MESFKDYVGEKMSLEEGKNLCQRVSENENITMMIAIDSDSEDSRTVDRDEIFAKHGFYRESPNKRLPLPESTYMGSVASEDKGEDTVKKIWKELKSRKLSPKKICGGIVNDWKVIRSKDDKD